MLSVFVNGRVMTGEEALREARLSAFDAGLTHGVGLFETMLAGVAPGALDEPGGPWAMHLDEHLERLCDSALGLGLASSLHAGPLGEAVLETVRRGGEPRARVRLTLTGGDLNLLSQARGGGGGGGAFSPTVVIVAQAAAPTPPAMLGQGVLVTLARTRPSAANVFEGHKTLNYWWRLHELRLAGARGAQEALVFDSGARLAGGCVSNVFLVRGGELLTPPARGERADGERATDDDESAVWPVLPGVTRQWAMQAGAARGVLTRRRVLTVDDLLAADEVLLTSSVWGVLPVTRVEGRTIGDGRPGPVTASLVTAFAREVEELVALA